jgi:hypothetical protein
MSKRWTTAGMLEPSSSSGGSSGTATSRSSSLLGHAASYCLPCRARDGVGYAAARCCRCVLGSPLDLRRVMLWVGLAVERNELGKPRLGAR